MSISAATWRPFTIPGSRPEVNLTRLEVDPGGGFTVLVRFPAGWERPGPGHYDAIEEVLFLAGSFEMSGHRFVSGDHGWFPTGYTRTGSRSPSGALALAWFSAPNRWTEAVAAGAEEAERGLTRATWTEQPVTTGPLGLAARALRVAEDRGSWLVDEVPDGLVVPEGVAAVDVFDLATHRYGHAVTGEPVPSAPVGPAWVRVLTRYP